MKDKPEVEKMMKNLISFSLILVVALLFAGCPPVAPLATPEVSQAPTAADFKAKQVEAEKAKAELRALKGREPTPAVEGEEIIRNADKKRLVRVKVITITQDDGSHCSPRTRVTLQVIRTKERRYICGDIGKAGDIFTIEWKLLKQWK